MLYMVVTTHAADNCPLANREVKDKWLSNSKRSAEVTKSLGITAQGSWTNLLSHTVYTLVDAPNAHVISQWFLEIKLLDWNTVVVEPVITQQEVAALMQKAI